VSRPSTLYYFTTLPLILRLGRVTSDTGQVSPLSQHFTTLLLYYFTTRITD
jgi:hypothetical protein